MKTNKITHVALLLAVAVTGCIGAPEDLGATSDPLTVLTEVWRADMSVQLSAVKSPLARTITYTFRATNGGDDAAREVVLSAHTPPGLLLRSPGDITWTGFDACTAGAPANNPSLVSIRCTASAMSVNQTNTVTVVISNPNNRAQQQASAQVSNIVPDYNPANNFQSVITP